jgi:hypothetical protein
MKPKRPTAPPNSCIVYARVSTDGQEREGTRRHVAPMPSGSAGPSLRPCETPKAARSSTGPSLSGRGKCSAPGRRPPY